MSENTSYAGKVTTPEVDDGVMSEFGDEDNNDSTVSAVVESDDPEQASFRERLSKLDAALRTHSAESFRLIVAAHSTQDPELVPSPTDILYTPDDRWDSIPGRRAVWLSALIYVPRREPMEDSDESSPSPHTFKTSNIDSQAQVADGPYPDAMEAVALTHDPMAETLLSGITMGDLSTIQEHLANMAIERYKASTEHRLKPQSSHELLNTTPKSAPLAKTLSGAHCATHLKETGRSLVQCAEEYLSETFPDCELQWRLQHEGDSVFCRPKDARRQIDESGMHFTYQDFGDWPPILPDLCEIGDCYRPSILARSLKSDTIEWKETLSDYASGKLSLTPFLDVRNTKDASANDRWYYDTTLAVRPKAVPTLSSGEDFDSVYPRGTKERQRRFAIADMFTPVLYNWLDTCKGHIDHRGNVSGYTRDMLKRADHAVGRVIQWGDDPERKQIDNARDRAYTWGTFTGLHVNEAKDGFDKMTRGKTSKNPVLRNKYRQYGVE